MPYYGITQSDLSILKSFLSLNMKELNLMESMLKVHLQILCNMNHLTIYLGKNV